MVNFDRQICLSATGLPIRTSTLREAEIFFSLRVPIHRKRDGKAPPSGHSDPTSEPRNVCLQLKPGKILIQVFYVIIFHNIHSNRASMPWA